MTRMVVPATLLRAGYKAKASVHSTTSFRPHSLPRPLSASARTSPSTRLSNSLVLPIRFPLYGTMHKHKEDFAQDPIRVTEPTVKQEKVGIPEHWDGPSGKAFKNPWDSFRLASVGDMFGVFRQSIANSPSLKKEFLDKIPVRKPTWAAEESKKNADKIKATWLGHACFFVELPSPSLQSDTSDPSRGARILFDPVFSDRCSPSQYIGPKRYTKAPCAIEDIPELDAIVISHNHYDHLDTHTITTLMKRPRPPHIFAPLGNADYFRSLGIPSERVHTMDWWESRKVEVEVTTTPSSSQSAFEVTCTPAQHRSGRGIHDQMKTLWASWAIREIVPTGSPTEREGVKLYFAGDTGYRNVSKDAVEEEVPTCPAFREIGKQFGSFDFAMIPIGAYQPRWFMSPMHCAPQDSVRIFQDVRAKKAIGMHWGTWVLTTEEITEPPVKLEEECKKANIPLEDFTVCDIGETVII